MLVSRGDEPSQATSSTSSYHACLNSPPSSPPSGVFNYASSPPSSPALCIDSSPASSPVPWSLEDEDDVVGDSDAGVSAVHRRVSSRTHAFADLYVDGNTPMTDPFAAIAHSGAWKPPDYEKRADGQEKTPHRNKRVRVQSTASDVLSEDSFKKARIEPAIFPEISLNPKVFDAAWSRVSQAEDVLQQAVDNAIDQGQGIINLNRMGIMELSRRALQDLGYFTAFPQDIELIHASTVLFSGPPTSSRRSIFGISRHGSPSFTKTPSSGSSLCSNSSARSVIARMNSDIQQSMIGLPRHDVHLYLAHNHITKLPRELFLIRRLKVLVLRDNNIKHIPPAVSGLVELETLNVSHNELKYLPSSMLGMPKLSRLLAFPNPFLPRPPPSSQVAVAPRTYYHKFHGSRVPSLTEICHRTMRVMDWDRRIGNVVIQNESVLRVLRDEPSGEREEWTTEQVCDGITCEKVYIRPVVECVTYETTFGTAPAGGEIPVMWRGCMDHCLRFLDGGRSISGLSLSSSSKVPDGEVAEQEDPGEEAIHVITGLGTGVGGFDFSDEDGQ
ncbi:hypothetical protein FISHEDRAFT_69449 [Fistulina hepatica ATCC 64428]|uniref:L domain-like protein n=1 Tax=Fistulina hepatica ATCC 64428 TaxID=1128425 RepID=A0A0D7ANU4_9AGAR|nr:hypothetical protein FISHEDRAFT_69449 [Fistulina hepatica ATCC 64428]